MRLLFVIFCLWAWQFLYSQSSANFERFSTLNGLPQNSVFSITQDSQGFIWLATYDGISRFDGTRFISYQPDPGNLRGISSNITNTLKADSNHQIWVGTTGSGFSVFDTRLLVFENFQADQSGQAALSNNNITCIEPDGRCVWIGTNHGLNLYDPEVSEIISFTSAQGLAGNYIYSLFSEPKGNLWVSTEGGVQLLAHEDGSLVEKLRLTNDPAHGVVKQVFGDSMNRVWLLSNHMIRGYEVQDSYQVREVAHINGELLDTPVPSLLQFNVMTNRGSDEFWVGTDLGLMRFELKKEAPVMTGFFENNINDVTSLPGNQIISLFTDQEGILWIGTRFSGLAKYDPYKQHITRYLHSFESVNTLHSNDVRAIGEDQDGNIWVGFRSEGVDFINRLTGDIRHFDADSETTALKNNSVRAIYPDRRNTLWVGYYSGFARIKKSNESQIHFNQAKDQYGKVIQIQGTPYVFFEDKRDDFWIGTSLGLFKYDRENGTCEWKLFKGADILPNVGNFIRSIAEDDKGNMWLATDGNGVYQYHPGTGAFKMYQHFLGDSATLAHNKVYCIVEDSNKKIWCGTHNGLSLFNAESESFISFTQEDGLSNNIVYGILPDKRGNLWLTTANGISKFNPQTHTFKTYLAGFEFSDDAYSKSPEGRIYAGGLNGFFAFHPDSLSENRHVPPVRFTGLRLYNQPVEIGKAINGRVLLPMALSHLEELVIHHDDTFFSIEFAVLSYASPEQNRYQFMLEGLHNDWIQADPGNPMATFSKLLPGNYVLRVKGANADGVWGETSIKIKVLPAIYQTDAFRWGIVVFITVLVFLFYRLRLRSLTRQKMVLEQTVTAKTHELRKQNHLLLQQKEEIKLQNEKVVEMARLLREADERKLQFFTNISHEIKTPLTLIKGPVEQLVEANGLNALIKSKLSVVQKYTKKLEVLVSQLLDFRKIDSGYMMLNCQPGNLKDLVSEVALFYRPFIENKRIQFSLEEGTDDLQGCYDEAVVEKVISNLLSNAVKYTPEGGMVQLSVEVNYQDLNRFAVIKVTDSGLGIPDKYRTRIFERFYRINDPDIKNPAEGTGIGLALSRDLARLHGGDLVLAESGSQGSTFLFTLPLKDSSHEQHDELTVNWPEDISQVIENYDDVQKGRFSVLIIEDNDDLRSFMASGLEDFQLYLARDGEEGLKLAFEKIPDLIVSDIMMPGLNGFQVCNQLKTHAATNHIPIILLTALDSSEHQQLGIEMGADDYILKPFNIKVLVGKIRNILIARQKFREQILGELSGAEGSFELTGDPFLADTMEILQKNLSDSSFGVEELGASMNMSRSTFYRKIKALTGITPVEFVRRIRISESCRLLKQVSGLTINELAFRVGFEDVNYFRECFKKQMGMTPREFQNQS